jgi:hypothetical protein
MDDHTVAIVSFDGAIKREIKRLRERLRLCEGLSEFSLEIEASGRVLDGDIDLSYSLSKSSYGAGKVSGDKLDAVLDEFLRRNGWEKLHAPKAIGYHKIPSDDTDEVPF